MNNNVYKNKCIYIYEFNYGTVQWVTIHCGYLFDWQVSSLLSDICPLATPWWLIDFTPSLCFCFIQSTQDMSLRSFPLIRVHVNPFTHFAAICMWTLNPFSVYVCLSQMILIMIICVHYFSKILSPILSHNRCSPQGVNIHIPLLDKFLRYFGLYAASWVVKKMVNFDTKENWCATRLIQTLSRNMQLC